MVTVQNPHCLINRTWENAIDRDLPPPECVAAGLFAPGLWPADGQVRRARPTDAGAPRGARIARYESVRKRRWGRQSLAAARRYNQLARDNGLHAHADGAGVLLHKWRVASTIIGVTSLAQLDEPERLGHHAVARGAAGD